MRRLFAALVLAQSMGCASLVTGKLADAMAGSGGGLGRDEDPELVADAAPFGLKTMESVLVSEPEHLGLLTALAGGFVQYSAAFVDMPADFVATEDLTRAQAMKSRAKKLYLRARNYALRGLDVEHDGFTARLRADAPKALTETEKDDVALLYWAAASWGLSIAADKNDTTLISDFPIVEALTARCLELDPTWHDGAIHELAMSIEMARPGGSAEKAKEHYEAALKLSAGTKAGTYVGYAESASVKSQNVAEFKQLLEKALAIDVDEKVDDRLANIIMQRRARWLLTRTDDLFLGGEDVPEEGAPQP